MATVWAISDHGAGEWARDALRRAGHTVLGMGALVARASLGVGLRPDLVLLDLRADGVYALLDKFTPTQLLCLGRPHSLVDGAMAILISNHAPCIPTAPGHELELVGAVQLQLERAGVTDV